MKKIKFINQHGDFQNTDKPVPAKTIIPNWYKNIKPYSNEDKNFYFDHTIGMITNITVKKCVPVMDVITSGYLITTYCDIEVRKDFDGSPAFVWPIPTKGFDIIAFHDSKQAIGHPSSNTPRIPKFKNIWGIQTPPGYSCLFMPPAHHDTPFNILPGIVDTDKFVAAVEFPFVFKDKDFSGLIPRGTPVAQVIPFKRDSWESEYSSIPFNTLTNHLRSFFVDGYRKLIWSKKHYN